MTLHPRRFGAVAGPQRGLRNIGLDQVLLDLVRHLPSGPHSPGREEGGQFAGARETTWSGRRIAFRTYLCPCSGGE